MARIIAVAAAVTVVVPVERTSAAAHVVAFDVVVVVGVDGEHYPLSFVFLCVIVTGMCCCCCCCCGR